MTSAYEMGNVPSIEVRHRLRIAREYARLEQEELANRMGTTRSTISNAEKGKGTPRRTTLNAWALACGVPVSWILTGETPPAPQGSNRQNSDYMTVVTAFPVRRKTSSAA